jgi:hypothetical protein
MLVPYRGSKDQEYPGRLSSRIESLLNQPEILHRPELSVKIAQTHFEYDVLAARLQDTIDRLFSRDSANPRERGVHSEATGAGG